MVIILITGIEWAPNSHFSAIQDLKDAKISFAVEKALHPFQSFLGALYVKWNIRIILISLVECIPLNSIRTSFLAS